MPAATFVSATRLTMSCPVSSLHTILTRLVFFASGHRLAAPVALSIGSSDLFPHNRPDGAWRGLVGILFCHSEGVDRAVKRIRCGRGVGKVIREVSIRCLLRGP